MASLTAMSAWASPGDTSPTCAPHDIGGYVAGLSKAIPGDARDGPLPRRVRGRSAYVDLGVGDVVCGGDDLSSPAQSPWTATVLLSGGGVPLSVRPGLPSRRVPRPTPWSWATDILTRFDQLFNQQAIDQISAARAVDKREGATALPTVAKVVVQWSPLIIEWRDERHVGSRDIEIYTSASPPLTRTISGAFIRLDLARDCPVSCTITADSPGGVLAYPLRIETVPETAAPRPAWLPAVGQDPARRALEGRWLLDESGQPDWRLQGRSALWSSACIFPVVLKRLHLHNSDVGAELCSPIAAKAGSVIP